MIKELLYTWVDVQAALQAGVTAWPDALLTARAYWDSVTIEYATEQRDVVATWLSEQFGPRWHDDGAAARIRLESRPGGPVRFLPVQLEPSPAPTPVATARRTFRQPDTVMRRKAAELPSAELSPQIFGWHSFKGGVGRTTTALQFARLLALRKARVMLIDMDFEAPGITWMTAVSRLPTPPISMSDVLALVHSTPPDELPETVQLIKERLQDSLVDGLVILPALRGTQREPDIRPEHLEVPGVPPLADILSSIARALDVTHVIVDLRAGRSEISASLLLDRRVARVLVTTAAGQSVKGTEEMLRDLREWMPEAETDPVITIIVSKLLVPGVFAFDKIKSELTEVADALLEEAEESSTEEPEDRPFPVRFTAALHDESLLALPLDWGDATARLDVTAALDVGELSVDLTFAQWVAEATPTTPVAPLSATDSSDINELRRALHGFANPLIHAEASSGASFHGAEFLKRLLQAHRSRLPRIVAVGAKGSGKTFTFLRLLANKTWQGFADASGSPAEVDGRVLPVVWPKNLHDGARATIDAVLGAPDRSLREAQVLRDALDDEFQKERSLSEWRGWWIDRLTYRAGLQTREELSSLTVDNSAPLLVIDGLEELLPDVHENDRAQLCLRALLQEVPDWLRASGSAAGLIVFARADYVRAAIPQNTEQFRGLYRSYELWWDRREALRLVAWMAREAGVVDKRLDDGNTLLNLWGRKMGSDSSRERNTDAWVLDALYTRRKTEGRTGLDSHEDLEARDLVRLLAQAAQLSISQGWDDRLLTPRAIRSALGNVGRAKIDEITEENPGLGGALQHFRGLAATLRVPFKIAELKNDADRAALSRLEEAGIAVQYGDEIQLVHAYQVGLGMHAKRRGRQPRLR